MNLRASSFPNMDIIMHVTINFLCDVINGIFIFFNVFKFSITPYCIGVIKVLNTTKKNITVCDKIMTAVELREEELQAKSK